MAFTKAAPLTELTPGKGKQVSVNGKKIALFSTGGKVLAIDDTCPHRGAPLHEGICSGVEVVCPWHAARFDLTTGAPLSPPAKSNVACYAVQVVGDEVQIDV
jgi:nitrite reductase (NADH) small subunit/3-phenylpropionate/trans-cinnamate dioxygenase ferredoxin subunit